MVSSGVILAVPFIIVYPYYISNYLSKQSFVRWPDQDTQDSHYHAL